MLRKASEIYTMLRNSGYFSPGGGVGGWVGIRGIDFGSTTVHLPKEQGLTILSALMPKNYGRTYPMHFRVQAETLQLN